MNQIDELKQVYDAKIKELQMDNLSKDIVIKMKTQQIQNVFGQNQNQSRPRPEIYENAFEIDEDDAILLCYSKAVQTDSLWRIVVSSKETQTDAPPK